MEKTAASYAFNQFLLRIGNILAFIVWFASLFGMAGAVMSMNSPDAGVQLAGWGAVFLVITFALIKMGVSGNKEFRKLLAETNAKHGLKFRMEADTWFGWDGTAIFFDLEHQKVLIYLMGHAEVKDLGYIRGCRELWDEAPGRQTPSYSNVRIEFQTNDIKQPVFYVRCFSKQQADAWMQRLRLILSQRR